MTSGEVPADRMSVAAGRRIKGLDAEQRRLLRREQILGAALGLFAERGFVNTSIEAICQTAYVSTKSFYEVFAGREDCFLALYSSVVDEYRTSIADVGAALDPRADGFAEAVIASLVDMLFADKHKAIIAFSTSRTVSDVVEAARRRNRSWTADFIEHIWSSMGYEIPRRRITVAFVAGLFEVVIDSLTGSDGDGPDARQSVIDDLVGFHAALRTGLDK